ncbi:MAG: ATPase [Silicimonas sp.]|nr:ATPase [Silicimonas sp.]
MSEWAPKRFWQNATVKTEGDAFTVHLDGRPVRTPGKRPLLVPTGTMAQRIAAEWQAQEDKINPESMPWTRSANSAIEKVAASRLGVEAHLIDYAGTDLLCYRAERPKSLIDRQSMAWEPILQWADQTFGARLAITSGVMPVEQPTDAIERLSRTMTPMSDFEMTGFYDLVTLSGSFLIGLAAVHEYASPDDLWAASRVDELWQIEEWGADEEAAEAAEIKKTAFLHATEFYRSA